MNTETGQRVSTFCTDNKGEYVSNEIKASNLKEKGTRQEFSAPYTPEQDNISERSNRNIRSLLDLVLPID